MCCLGQVARAQPGETVNPNWRCCDTQAFDPSTHECLECSGFRRLVSISEAYSCCGITPFSRLTSLCCNGRVLQLGKTYASLAVLPQFACCGSRSFNPDTQTCCSCKFQNCNDQTSEGCLRKGYENQNSVIWPLGMCEDCFLFEISLVLKSDHSTLSFVCCSHS